MAFVIMRTFSLRDTVRVRWIDGAVGIRGLVDTMPLSLHGDGSSKYYYENII
jgi:hypothetical protein